MSTETIVEQIEAAENGRDWEALVSLFDPEVTIVHPGLGPVVGADNNLAVMRYVIGAIDGYRRSTNGLVIDGERGAFRYTITGTHTGDLPGYPASGEAVEIGGAMFFEVRSDRLLRALRSQLVRPGGMSCF